MKYKTEQKYLKQKYYHKTLPRSSMPLLSHIDYLLPAGYLMIGLHETINRSRFYFSKRLFSDDGMSSKISSFLAFPLQNILRES